MSKYSYLTEMRERTQSHCNATISEMDECEHRAAKSRNTETRTTIYVPAYMTKEE